MAEVVIVKDSIEGGSVAAGLIARLVRRKPDAVLGLATGSTPLSTWQALAKLNLDLSKVRGFALDEYVGLPVGHPQSYRSVISREVVGPLRLTPEFVRVPADSGPLETAGDDYEQAIRDAGGVDLQVLGIGRTGHIGFNEPGSSLASLTRVKTLTEATRTDNARFFDSPDQVPTHCITQGLGTILRAKHLVLLAFGAAKAPALAGAVEGPVTSSLPGSVIQLHPNVTVIADEAAAAELKFADYYRNAWNSRLDWERD
ncbi:MAG: glucosamine-6-phosphate deaminase [Cryobacterium sp.]|nr:glucosamine-6-phosphate deaminase [Cryobacterium sp.]MBX3116881.1 glucosamine-6-phosphate deaminase [Cryobacterium sp.]MCO5294746.1 glucosamine-6-phosphate deaminase [Homoserinimonas sp.]